MLKFRTHRPLRGDYGPKGEAINIAPGDIFEVPDFYAKRLEPLEAKGIIERYIERPARKAYTVYESKAIVPAENKAAVERIGRRRR